jgi:hypothetical protein
MLCGHSFCQVSPALVLEVALELVHETVKVGLLCLAGSQCLLVASPAPPVPRLDCTVVKVCCKSRDCSVHSRCNSSSTGRSGSRKGALGQRRSVRAAAPLCLFTRNSQSTLYILVLSGVGGSYPERHIEKL